MQPITIMTDLKVSFPMTNFAVLATYVHTSYHLRNVALASFNKVKVAKATLYIGVNCN